MRTNIVKMMGGQTYGAPEGHGDCFEVGGRFIIDKMHDGDDDWKLVHGIVTGQGPVRGLRFGHCWLEHEGMVYDYSNNNVVEGLPREIYYRLGHIEKDDIIRYSPDDASKKILEFEHWGPWEGVTETRRYGSMTRKGNG